MGRVPRQPVTPKNAGWISSEQRKGILIHASKGNQGDGKQKGRTRILNKLMLWWDEKSGVWQWYAFERAL